MTFLFRCPECRTRRRDHGLFSQHLRATGHRLCGCGGYHYEHRPGSRFCERNPMSAALLASRYGASDEEATDIALEIVLTTRGRTALRCPF